VCLLDGLNCAVTRASNSATHMPRRFAAGALAWVWYGPASKECMRGMTLAKSGRLVGTYQQNERPLK
jgi:hypothetical protein